MVSVSTSHIARAQSLVPDPQHNSQNFAVSKAPQAEPQFMLHTQFPYLSIYFQPLEIALTFLQISLNNVSYTLPSILWLFAQEDLSEYLVYLPYSQNQSLGLYYFYNQKHFKCKKPVPIKWGESYLLTVLKTPLMDCFSITKTYSALRGSSRKIPAPDKTKIHC